jgi:hypothetical protein
MRKMSLMTGGDDGEAPQTDLRSQYASSKKSPSQSLSFAFHASSFSFNKPSSERSVPRSLRSVVQKPDATHRRRKSESAVPAVFVNPPTFCLQRGTTEGSVRQTMGVPMISIAEDTSPEKKKHPSKPASFKVQKSPFQRKSSRGTVLVSPPSIAVTQGGTSRARWTLGVPMV